MQFITPSIKLYPQCSEPCNTRCCYVTFHLFMAYPRINDAQLGPNLSH